MQRIHFTFEIQPIFFLFILTLTPILSLIPLPRMLFSARLRSFITPFILPSVIKMNSSA